MEATKTFTAFAGFQQITSGDLKTMLTDVWQHLATDNDAPLLIFDDSSGRQQDFNFRGTLEEVLAGAIPRDEPRKPGRPKLGVVCREISLLPRHWEWLDNQPRSASATIRRLVEAARKQEEENGNGQQRIQAADRIRMSLAGNLEGCEEASRALYTADKAGLAACTADWPRDVKNYLERILTG